MDSLSILRVEFSVRASQANLGKSIWLDLCLDYFRRRDLYLTCKIGNAVGPVLGKASDFPKPERVMPNQSEDLKKQVLGPKYQGVVPFEYDLKPGAKIKLNFQLVTKQGEETTRMDGESTWSKGATMSKIERWDATSTSSAATPTPARATAWRRTSTRRSSRFLSRDGGLFVAFVAFHSWQVSDRPGSCFN